MTRFNRMLLVAAGAAAVALGGATNGWADAAGAKKEAQEIFAMRCTPCHGPSGAGDGPGSAGLTPKPRNFTDPEWQKSVTDAHIENIIKFGGIAVGKSPAMPSNPDLMAKPEVVTALRELVRSFKK
ncbi:MAG: c-type cytochrome [Deltaproteobacteria bacterium]|nr:c-type cytochrome [Deltaproteobacteria bacterium]